MLKNKVNSKNVCVYKDMCVYSPWRYMYNWSTSKKTRKVYCKSFLAAIAREEWSWHRGGVSHHFSRNFWTILGSCHTEVYIGQCRLPLTKRHRLSGLTAKKYFLPVTGTGSPKCRSDRVGFWWQRPPWLADSHLLAMSSPPWYLYFLSLSLFL